MNDERAVRVPSRHQELLEATKSTGFQMGSDLLTGNFLRTLATTKRKGRFLEIGTGTGLSAAWLLDGMDPQSTLLSVDNDPQVVSIARQYLGSDRRLTLKVADGAEFIKSLAGQKFDLIFADSWPGKFESFEETLRLVAPGGFYVVDDMLPQPNWVEGHDLKVEDLLLKFETIQDFQVCKMSWSTGLILCARKRE
jgi:predicted O-methyltransferase YrrM